MTKPIPQEQQEGNCSGASRIQNQAEGNLNNWLPLTASRKAKWYYSAFHNVTAMVGAGVLALPFAVSQLCLVPGIVSIVVSWLVTLYSLWQMVEMHEFVPGKRFDRYTELGMHSLGPKLGYWLVMPQQMMVQVATNIIYMVTGGKSLKKFFQLIVPHFHGVRECYFTGLFSILEFFLSQTPNFNDLKVVSFVAALMSCGYSMVAFIASMIHYASSQRQHVHIDYGYRSHTTFERVFDNFNALGTVSFAFAAHCVVLEIQASIPSTPEKPSKKPMWRGAVLAYAIVLICYSTVAISGFLAFGTRVEDDVLISLERPRWLIAAANLMVFLHVLGAYQVFAMPVFDMMESYLVQRRKLTPSRSLRIIARSSYVAFTATVGICIPFFGGLIGFFGGLAYTSTTYILPCAFWLMLVQPKRFSIHWILSWVCILIGGIITIVAPLGGMRQILLSANNYTLFS